MKIIPASSAFVYTKRHFACWEVSQSHNITVPVAARFRKTFCIVSVKKYLKEHSNFKNLAVIVTSEFSIFSKCVDHYL